jgi:ribosomal protein S18 acetylase RimI-like enzyme
MTATRMESVTIKTAEPADEAAVIAVISLAFGADPNLRWGYPEPHVYLSEMPRFIRAFAGSAFAHGSAHYVEGYAGAALWLPPGVQPDEDGIGALIQGTVSEDKQGDVFAIFEQMASYHPDEPHWYLALMGVDPALHNQGYGSLLMEHALESCDRDHLPVYLESSNPRNIPFYQRHGFEVLGTIQSGTSPDIVPMLRQPR